MDIDILKNISIAKPQISSPHDKRAVKDVQAPHRDEEAAKVAEKVKQETLSVKTVRMNYDTDIDRVVITVIDSQNQEVVRQVPGTDSITFMKRFQQIIQETSNKKV
ncbi:MAG: hypothetical protein C0392_01685 [Syntrophus sp. (in: bacteria)]|nr:hypothetical protein [Syntrophus sp. (in: bacteria)]